MFPHSYKKFFTFLVLSLALGLAATAMLEPGEPSTSGLAVYDIGTLESGFDWPVFFFGLAIGSFILGALVYIVQYETKRL